MTGTFTEPRIVAEAAEAEPEIAPTDDTATKRDAPERAPGGARHRLARAVRRLWRSIVAGRWFWPFAVAYGLLGWWLATRIDLVVPDALARASAASLVWHNGQPKLAAMGFAWPPLTTLPLLPFTMFDTIARTGLASALVSALVMAGVIAVVRSELARLGVPAWGAIPTCILLALHPMLVFYGANGMSEASGVLAITVLVVALARWVDEGSTTALAVASFAAALGMLARYELGVLAPALAAGVFIAVAIGRRDLARGRALAIFVLVPAIFCGATWMYFNWVVQGSPVWFLTDGYQLATIDGSAKTIGGAAALATMSRTDAAAAIVNTHAIFAPLVPVMLVMTLLLALRRRWVALFLAGIALTGLVTPLAIAVLQDNPWMAQLRFNMRMIPTSIVATAWLARELGLLSGGWRRHLVAGILVTAGVVAIPATAQLMREAPLRFMEPSFLRAVTERRALTGTLDASGQAVGCASARAMGAWIDANVTRRDTILADTSSTYAVLAYSGHPERFVDPVDHGSAWFIDMLNNPVKRIRYVLVSDFSTCSGVTGDLVSERHPELFETGNDGQSTLIHAEAGFRLYTMPRPRPGATSMEET